MSPDYEDLLKRPRCIFFYLKAKTSLLCLRYECAHEVEDNFNELIQQIELESISKDSSDAAICMGYQSSNRSKDVLQCMASTEGKDGESTERKEGESTEGKTGNKQ